MLRVLKVLKDTKEWLVHLDYQQEILVGKEYRVHKVL